VWVLARVDGKFAFTGTLEPNARRVFDGEEGRDAAARQRRRAYRYAQMARSIGTGPVQEARPRTPSVHFRAASRSSRPDRRREVPFDPLDRL